MNVEKPKMHITMARLYSAVRASNGAELSQSEMAKKLNESSQVIKNWEARGISFQGLLNCQRSLGVNCAWLYYGEGTPLLPREDKIKIAGMDIDTFDAQLNKHFQLLSDAHKDAVLMLVNKLYIIDNPEDAKATGRKTGKKEAKQ